MKAYSFDLHGVFMGEVEMQKDPLESRKAGKDVWLLPARATLTPPPTRTPAENELLVWNGSRWAYESVPTDPLEPGFFYLWANGGWSVQKDQTYVAPEVPEPAE